VAAPTPRWLHPNGGIRRDELHAPQKHSCCGVARYKAVTDAVKVNASQGWLENCKGAWLEWHRHVVPSSHVDKTQNRVQQ
jgi:hypothetical protein